MSFAERLKVYRERAGLTQRELAQMVCVDQAIIGRYEMKNGTLPRVDMLLKLAYALGCSVNDLAGYVPPDCNFEKVQRYLKKYNISVTIAGDSDSNDPEIQLVMKDSEPGKLYGSIPTKTRLSNAIDIIRRVEKEALEEVDAERQKSIKERLGRYFFCQPLIAGYLYKLNNGDIHQDKANLDEFEAFLRLFLKNELPPAVANEFIKSIKDIPIKDGADT